MGILQWTLLIVGVVAVAVVYVVSRREKRAPGARNVPPVMGRAVPPNNQMEIFPQAGEFDEFGVGKPRVRTPPQMPATQQAAAAPANPMTVADQAQPAAKAKPEPAPAAPIDEKIIALLIAEREGTAILGPKLHKALQNQHLVYGERKIYHRLDADEETVFSVAGLLKPGQLDPEDAKNFSTPGLSVFMVLPGPPKPVAALRDMLETCRGLARNLNAELFDTRRQPFTAESERKLLAEVEDWARRNP